jgi:hypothetical protein
MFIGASLPGVFRGIIGKPSMSHSMDPQFRRPLPWIFCVPILEKMKIGLENYRVLSHPLTSSLKVCHFYRKGDQPHQTSSRTLPDFEQHPNGYKEKGPCEPSAAAPVTTWLARTLLLYHYVPTLQMSMAQMHRRRIRGDVALGHHVLRHHSLTL